jgi:hypothetical protein
MWVAPFGIAERIGVEWAGGAIVVGGLVLLAMLRLDI